MRFLFFSLLAGNLLALPAAAQVLPAPRDTVATRYQLPGADCALFPAAASMGPYSEYIPETGRFTPSREQVTNVEKILPAVRLQDVYERPANSYYADYPGIIKARLAEYNRQYYGFYNLKHQPCLYINFFPGKYEQSDNKDPHWLHWPIYVSDGGAGFWQIFYNLSTNKFYNFSHNLEG